MMKAALCLGAILALGSCTADPAGEGLPHHDGGPTIDDGGHVLDDGGQVVGDDGGIGTSQLSIYKSGTRIKMRVMTTPDGAKMFQGWRDTQRNENCGFATASDGVTRCLPYTGAASTNNYYADSGCSTRLAHASTGCSASDYEYALQYETVSACPAAAEYHVYPVTGSHPGSVFYDDGSTCEPAAAWQLDNYTFFTIGAEISPSQFQAATESLE